jgi:hypothetical protein
MKNALILLACLASTNVCAFADETSVSNTTTKTDVAPTADTSVSSTEVKSKHHGNKVKATTTKVESGAAPVSSTTSTTNTKVSQ